MREWSTVQQALARRWRQSKTRQDDELTPNFPQLPVELWRIILRYTIRLRGASRIDLPDHFLTKVPDDSECILRDSGFIEDRINLSHVCQTFRRLVTEISVEYMVITNGRQLEYMAMILKTSEKRLGESAVRLDMQIRGRYKPKYLSTILEYAPNLLVFVNRNGINKENHGRIPKQMMLALIMYGRNIRRIEFHTTAEAPTLYDLIDISRHLTNVNTLYMLCVHAYPTNPAIMDKLPPLVFPNLKTLSLGLIPEPTEPRKEYALTWDPFFSLVSMSECQLPKLERLDTELFPTAMPHFFVFHGHKLRTFKLTTWSASFDSVLADGLNLCINLHDLVLAIANGDRVVFPTAHPSIQRICITSLGDEDVHVPKRVFDIAVMTPLNSLLHQLSESFTSASPLKEVRVNNSGGFAGLIPHACADWLDSWWRRWNVRGVAFVDRIGEEYKDFKLVPDEVKLLNTIRE
ncbi:hypothetical protein BKA70DRAFT_1372363 [Coprinopsis sp. MPI-PUGE-AT-0042]|nr:hypothetical protein BKA70DRAFT_1372363 [Coprinopsis sp. MPI-PUGE-AT-0042]